jgi:hypothetical protein
MENLSFGKQLVGIDFNPSGDANVTSVKILFAAAADIVDKCREESIANGTYNSVRQLIIENCFSEILNAQMNVVKVITLP